MPIFVQIHTYETSLKVNVPVMLKVEIPFRNQSKVLIFQVYSTENRAVHFPRPMKSLPYFKYENIEMNNFIVHTICQGKFIYEFITTTNSTSNDISISFQHNYALFQQSLVYHILVVYNCIYHTHLVFLYNVMLKLNLF